MRKRTAPISDVTIFEKNLITGQYLGYYINFIQSRYVFKFNRASFPSQFQGN